MTIAYDVI